MCKICITFVGAASAAQLSFHFRRVHASLPEEQPQTTEQQTREIGSRGYTYIGYRINWINQNTFENVPRRS